MLAKSFKSGRWADFGKFEKGVRDDLTRPDMRFHPLQVTLLVSPQTYHRCFAATSGFGFPSYYVAKIGRCKVWYNREPLRSRFIENPHVVIIKVV